MLLPRPDVPRRVPRHTVAWVARELAEHGYNAEREAVTLLAGADDPGRTLRRAVDHAPDSVLTLSVEHVRAVLDGGPTHRTNGSGGTSLQSNQQTTPDSPVEQGG